MDIMIFEPSDDLERLRSLLDEWKLNANSEKLGIPLNVDTAMGTIRTLIHSPYSDLLVAVDDSGQIHGFIGAYFQPNHVGPGLFAHECLFYVSAEKRGCGISLLRAFRRLAKSKGCTHIILNASHLAGDATQSARLFMAFGCVQMDTSYIGVI